MCPCFIWYRHEQYLVLFYRFLKIYTHQRCPDRHTILQLIFPPWLLFLSTVQTDITYLYIVFYLPTHSGFKRPWVFGESACPAFLGRSLLSIIRGNWAGVQAPGGRAVQAWLRFLWAVWRRSWEYHTLCSCPTILYLVSCIKWICPYCFFCIEKYEHKF